MSEYNRALFEQELARMKAAHDGQSPSTALEAAIATASKALERLAQVDPLIQAAWRYVRGDIAEWELIHHAKLVGAAEIERRNKLT